MESLYSAVMRGEQSLSWVEFQAAMKACYVASEEDTSTPTEGNTAASEEDTSVLAEGSEGDMSTTRTVSIASGGAASASASAVKVELENQPLWKQFDEITNEMIITKAGRRMFPLLQVSLSGLHPTASYAILLEFQLTVLHRWRFLNGEWQSTTGNYSSNEPPEHRTLYIHPSSPSTGRDWMKDKVTFSKLKLSNKDDGKGKIKLQSLYRYQPQLHIIQLPSPPLRQEEVKSQQHSVSTHVFTETQFVAVTAYQNDKITQMKIRHNPYAKAFQGPQDTIHFSSASNVPSQTLTTSHHYNPLQQPHPPVPLITPTQGSQQHPYRVLSPPLNSWLPVSPYYLHDTHHPTYYPHNGAAAMPMMNHHHEQCGVPPSHLIGQWAPHQAAQAHDSQCVAFSEGCMPPMRPQQPQLECYYTTM